MEFPRGIFHKPQIILKSAGIQLPMLKPVFQLQNTTSLSFPRPPNRHPLGNMLYHIIIPRKLFGYKNRTMRRRLIHPSGHLNWNPPIHVPRNTLRQSTKHPPLFVFILLLGPRDTGIKIREVDRRKSELVVLGFQFGGVKENVSEFEMGPQIAGSGAGEIVAVVVDGCDSLCE